MLNGNDQELLSAYLDGALSDEERATLEARLQSDAALRRELARLRATVALIKTLPTLPAPRPLTLTPRMVRRPTILTSAAFSALSAAAAIILLVLGAALFTLPSSNFAPAGAARNIAALPTPTASVSESQAGGANNAVLPPIVDNLQVTMDKSTTEPGQDSTGILGFVGPTDTSQPSIEAQLYAAPLPLGTPADEGDLQADASVAQSQPLAPSPDDQLRTQSEQAAPSSAMDGAAAVAQAPTFAASTATVAPSATSSATPSDTPTPTNTVTLMNTPAPTTSALMTLVPTTIPQEENTASETNVTAVGLIVVALVLFGVAIVTTILRRRT